MNIIHTIRSHKLLYLLVVISIVYFMLKGIDYANIGSYIPLIFASSSLAFLILSAKHSYKMHRKVLILWALFIIIWALARFVIFLIFQIDGSITESHVREQFGLLQQLLTALMLLIGMVVLKNTKHIKSVEIA